MALITSHPFVARGLFARPLSPGERAKMELDNIARGVDLLTQRLTTREQVLIAFAPTIIAELAWWYLDNAVCDHAAACGITQLKKLTRAIHAMRADYDKVLQVSLDQRHREYIKRTAKQLRLHEWYDALMAQQRMYLSELERMYPDDPYHLLRADAYMALAMYGVAKRHNKWTTKLLTDKVGAAQAAPLHKQLEAIPDVCEAFIAPCHLPRTLWHDKREVMILRRLHAIEYTLSDIAQTR